MSDTITLRTKFTTTVNLVVPNKDVLPVALSLGMDDGENMTSAVSTATGWKTLDTMSVFFWFKSLDSFGTMFDAASMFEFVANGSGSSPWYITVFQGASKKRYGPSTSGIHFDGNWHQIGFTYTVDTFKIYADGVELTSLTILNNDVLTGLGTASTGIRLTIGTGSRKWPSNQYDHFIVNRVLTDAEILEAYHNGTAYLHNNVPLDYRTFSFASSLVAYWKSTNALNAIDGSLGDAAGNRILDVIGSNYLTPKASMTADDLEADIPGSPTRVKLATKFTDQVNLTTQ